MFVGRRSELARLHAAWDTAQRGTACVVGVEGAPGIGKTVLVRRFLAVARPDVLVWVSGDDAETGLPWGVLAQIARTLPGRPWDATTDPVFAGHALAAALAQRNGTILVVDDAHWGDPLSMAAIRLAARRLTTESVLVVVIYQPIGAPGLGDGWRRLFESDRGQVVRLAGLPAADLVALAVAAGRPGLSPAGAARLYEHTGGHPMHVRHLLDEVPLHSITFGDSALPPPREVAVAVRARLASCRPATRDLVAAAAVLGRRARLAAVRELAGVSDTADALAEAVAAHLLDEVPGTAGGELAFTSSLVLGLVYHELDPVRRRDLHRGAALRGGPGVLRHRIGAASGPDEELAAAIETEAHQQLAADRIPLAAQYFRHALELTPAGPARAPRLLAATEALLLAGDIATAVEYQAEIDAADGPWADYVGGYLLLLIGAMDAALARLHRAWDTASQERRPADREPVDLAARIASQLAIIGVLTGAYTDMIEYGAAAVATARVPWVMTFALFAKCLGLAVAGRGDAALGALADADAAGSPAGLDGLVARGMIRLWTDDLAGARQDLTKALTRALAGEPLRIAQALGFLGEAEYRCGALGEAVVHTEAAVGDAEENNRVWDYATLHALATYPLAALGDWERAEFHAATSAALAQRVGMPAGLVYAAAAEAAIAEARADPKALCGAAEKLEAYYPSAEPGTHLCGPLRADALAQLGKAADAADALTAFLERAGPNDRLSTRAAVARVRARLAVLADRPDEALRHCRTAVDSALAAGLPLEVGRAELLAGECQQLSGRRAAAERVLRSALRRFTAMGATAYAAQAVGALERAGLPAGPARGVLDALTPAERAVATCVCQGLSNGQTARRLLLSTKTVEFHLTNVFRKLDVRGRAELRRVVTESVP